MSACDGTMGRESKKDSIPTNKMNFKYSCEWGSFDLHQKFNYISPVINLQVVPH